MYQVSNLPLHPRTPDVLRGFVGRTKPQYRVFVVSITDKCNIQCDFCCHPYQNTGISDEESELLVSQAVRLDFDEICFTGGEPFIRRSALLRAAQLCKQHGKLFGVISNGYWAGSRAKADKVIATLVEAGLTRITISWDPSHGAFVSVATAQNALDASLDRGLKVTLTGSFKEPGDCHENHGFQLEHLRRYRNFSVYTHPVSPAGDGEALSGALSGRDPKLAQSSMRCPSQEVIELVCYDDKNSLVQPCCSVFAGYKMENLRVGNWRQQSVQDLLMLQEGDPFFLILREGGFRRIYDIIEQADPNLHGKLPAYGDAASVCHFCSKVLQGDTGPQVRKAINDYMTGKLLDMAHLAMSGPSAMSIDPAAGSGLDRQPILA
jgi:hypothetical protein